MTDLEADPRHGPAYALAAYTFWGFVPVYFVLVGFAGPLEVLAQRILWSLPVLIILVSITRQWRTLVSLTRREYLYLACSALCLSVNWLAFIWAIGEGNIVEASLGYFITPLVSVLLGWAILKEQMRVWQWWATAIAATGIVTEFIVEQSIPIFGLSLAISFGLYGLLRKQVNLPASVGLSVEAVMLTPIAFVYLIFLYGRSTDRSITELSQLGLGGLVTVVPLVCFAAAAIRLPLTTLGIYQYLAPSLSLLLAVYVYGETVAPIRWLSLMMIWLAIVIFSVGGLYHRAQTSSS